MNRCEAWIENRLLRLGTYNLAIPANEQSTTTATTAVSWIPDKRQARWHEIRLPLAAPIDYLLALAESPSPDRVWEIRGMFGAFGLLGKPTRGYLTVKAAAEVLSAWRKQRLPNAFLLAAQAGARGSYSATLGKHLERLEFGAARDAVKAIEREAEIRPALVPDLPALAAWMQLEILRAGRRYEVRDCGNCRLPFLASPRANYCARTAPESQRQTCQDYAKVKNYYARKRSKGASDGDHR